MGVHAPSGQTLFHQRLMIQQLRLNTQKHRGDHKLQPAPGNTVGRFCGWETGVVPVKPRWTDTGGWLDAQGSALHIRIKKAPHWEIKVNNKKYNV